MTGRPRGKKHRRLPGNRPDCSRSNSALDSGPDYLKPAHEFECMGCRKAYTARNSLDRHWEGYPHCESRHVASGLNKEQRDLHAGSVERRKRKDERLRYMLELRQSRKK